MIRHINFSKLMLQHLFFFILSPSHNALLRFCIKFSKLTQIGEHNHTQQENNELNNNLNMTLTK